jgi:hypothetical protein
MIGRSRCAKRNAGWFREMTMDDELLNPPRRVKQRQPFEKVRSGNPAGRRRGSRNRATLAAAVLLEGESEALTHKAVELALAGDPVALRLCIERILPVCVSAPSGSPCRRSRAPAMFLRRRTPSPRPLRGAL